MARTRTRRSRAARSAAPALPDISTVARGVLRPEVLGTILVVLAVASIPYLVPLTGVVGEFRDLLVQAFGLHVFTLIVLLAGAGVLLATKRADLLGRHARHIAGMLALLVFLAGLLGLWQPATRVGGVDFAEVSAGGDAGRALTSNVYATLAWLGLLVAGFALLWPRTARAVATNAPRVLWETLRWLWDLGLHRRLGHALAAVPGVLARLNRRPDAPVVELEVPEAAPKRAKRKPAETDAVIALEADAGTEIPEVAVAPAPRRRTKPVEEDLEAKPAAQLLMDMETPVGEWRESADGWQIPPMKMLAPQPAETDRTVDNGIRARLIEQTLSSFGVDAKVVEINTGPTVTQFGLEPGWDVKTKAVVERDAAGAIVVDPSGAPRTNDVEIARTRIRVNRITALQNDLALALAAPALRIEAPVPGKAMVGIEVPNGTTSVVTLRQVMESAAFKNLAEKGALPIALGAGVSGDAVVADLAKMPHLLIAGATGAGKSVGLNSIIACLLMNFSPEQLRFVMVDPKRVEMTAYQPIPHLAFSEIVVEMDRVVGTLQAVINEMETRYRRFAQVGVRNIERYNEKEARKLPYWVVIIDELADLMLAAPFQVEHQLVRLAQLARATGIHLIVATQRPSVDVITGLIKANFPTRIAFAVSSMVDSRTILDQGGAEKLLGKGDMLFLAPDAQKPKRVQGVYVKDDEIEAIVSFWTQDRFKKLVPEKYDAMLEQALDQAISMGPDGSTPPDAADDPMIQRAMDVAKGSKSLSTSMLQRKLGIGYPRAARLMDLLEERGVVGPQEPGSKPRDVLIDGDGDAIGGVDAYEPASLAAHAASFTPKRREEPPADDGLRPRPFPPAFDSD